MSFHTPWNGKDEKNKTPNVGEDLKQSEETSYITGESAKGYKHFGKLCQYLLKSNIYPPYEPGILLLGIYPREGNVYQRAQAC